MNPLNLTLGKDYVTHPDYRFVTVRAITFDLGMGLEGNFEFRDGKKLIAVLNNDDLTIATGYAWDGNSPAFCWFKRWWSPTPTLKCGFGPSLAHDFTRQFHRVAGCLWTREDTDTLFYKLIVAGGSSELAGLYHYFVSSKIGTAYIAATYKENPDLKVIKI